MAWSLARLDEAIKHFLGDGVYASLNGSVGVGRPRMHEMAIVKAFMVADTSEHATVLRDMNLLLQRHRFYKTDRSEDHADA
jgi:hypothetical protein